MTNAKIDKFLRKTGWQHAHQTEISGDASRRAYRRLHSGDKTAVLMIDPDDHVGAFVAVAEYLAAAGLRPPEVYDYDLEIGLCLLEDFGSTTFAKRLTEGPKVMAEILQLGLDVSFHLAQAAPMENRSELSPSVAADLTREGLSWLGLSNDLIEGSCAKLQAVLTDIDGRRVTSLRDYHAENLMWCTDGSGLHQAGLLDFQDAVLGPAIYDIVSLIADPRRMPMPDVEGPLLESEAKRSEMEQETFYAAFNAWSLQRNLRVAGLFYRLTKTGRGPYARFFPATLARLTLAIEDPALAPFADLVGQIEMRFGP